MSYLCHICGAEIPEGEEFIIDGQAYCHDCYDDEFFVCDDCGAITKRSDMMTVNPGIHHTWNGEHTERFICRDCFDRETESNDIFTCHDCGDTLDRWYRSIYGHNAYGEYVEYCENCSENYTVCANCGDVINRDWACWDDYNEEYYCESCYDEMGANSIANYGYKPSPVFGTTDDADGRSRYDGTDLTFGVELECDDGDYPRKAAAEIHTLTDRLYIKHDGSLNDGYEVVTHPGTLAWHMNVFPWEDVCKVSRSYGFRSHDAGTCGLHIHIGRKQLGADAKERGNTVARLIMLSNAVWPEIVRFSRRDDPREWAGINPCFNSLKPGMSDEQAYEKTLDRSYCAGRYLAVNIQNDATVELRFNRGTLKLNTIYACLQLASNMALYAKDKSIDDCISAKWDDVVHYHEYDELTSYVNTRFADWTANENERPVCHLRDEVVNNPPDINPGDAIKAFGYIEYAPEGTEAVAGDTVVLVRRPFDGGPAVGSIGVRLRNTDDGILWNDHNFAGHNWTDRNLPRRQWRMTCDHYRVITRVNDVVVDSDVRAKTLAMVNTYHVVPGDRVFCDTADSYGFITVQNLYGAPLGVYDTFTGGHNGAGILPIDSRNGWWSDRFRTDDTNN